MHNLFDELGIQERLKWALHRMTFAMQELPAEFTTFEFPEGVPAPFNMAVAILGNTEMLTLEEKIRMVPALLSMLLEGQVRLVPTKLFRCHDSSYYDIHKTNSYLLNLTSSSLMPRTSYQYYNLCKSTECQKTSIRKYSLQWRRPLILLTLTSSL